MQNQPNLSKSLFASLILVSFLVLAGFVSADGLIQFNNQVSLTPTDSGVLLSSPGGSLSCQFEVNGVANDSIFSPSTDFVNGVYGFNATAFDFSNDWNNQNNASVVCGTTSPLTVINSTEFQVGDSSNVYSFDVDESDLITGLSEQNLSVSTSAFTKGGVNYFEVDANNLIGFAPNAGLGSKIKQDAACAVGCTYNLTIDFGDPTITFPSGVIAADNLTVYNMNPSYGTGANFTQYVQINATNFTGYMNTNLSNVEFFNYTGYVLPSWLEYGTNSSQNASWWVQIPQGIAANSNYSLYAGFASNATSFYNQSGQTGEAPNLSATYGVNDNGQNVFTYYTNFSGTSLPSGWTASNQNYVQDNGISILNASSPSPGYLGYNLTVSSLPFAEDTYFTSLFGSSGGSWANFAWGAGTNLDNPVDNPSAYLINTGGEWYTNLNGSDVGTTTPSNNTIYTISFNSSNTGFYYNYSTIAIRNGVGSSNMSAIALQREANYGAGIIAIQWWRTRPLPPGGVMPTVYGNGIVLPPIEITTNLISPSNALNVSGIPSKSGNVNFSYFVNSSVGTFGNATLWSNFSGTWTANVTNQSSMINGSSGLDYLNVTHIPDGVYIWNVRACDTSNNCSFASSNFTLTVDKTNPLNAIQVMPLNNTYNSFLIQNITFIPSDALTGAANTTVYIFNSSGAINYALTNTTITNGSQVSFNVAVSNGQYNWTVQTCDYANNCANTTFGNFTIAYSLGPVIPPTPLQGTSYLFFIAIIFIALLLIFASMYKNDIFFTGVAGFLFIIAAVLILGGLTMYGVSDQATTASTCITNATNATVCSFSLATPVTTLVPVGPTGIYQFASAIVFFLIGLYAMFRALVIKQ